jgi:hypothetical protein
MFCRVTSVDKKSVVAFSRDISVLLYVFLENPLNLQKEYVASVASGDLS